VFDYTQKLQVSSSQIDATSPSKNPIGNGIVEFHLQESRSCWQEIEN